MPDAARTVVIRLGSLALTATLNDPVTAKLLARSLPMTSTAHRWGHELYWATPVVASHESPTQNVTVGDLGYWVEGQSLCMFFGRTPASLDQRPRPAVPINLVGRFTLDERLRAVHDGAPVQIYHP